MRICLCISGEVRPDTSTLRPIVEMFAGMDVHYVITTWQHAGKADGKRPAARTMKTLPEKILRLAGPSALDDGVTDAISTYLSEKLSPLVPDLINHTDFDFMPPCRTVVDIVDPRLVLTQVLCNHIPSHNWRMWYLLSRADEHRKKLELEQAKPFDIIVRLRTDARIADNFVAVLEAVAKGVAEGTVYLDGLGPDWIGDQIFVANSEIMTLCSDYFRKHRDPLEIHRFSCDAHKEPYKFFKHQGIKAAALPMVNFCQASRLTIGPVTFASQYTDAFTEQHLANYTGAHGDRIRDLHRLFRHLHVVEKTDQPGRLQHLLAELDARPPHPENRFAVSDVRSEILFRLGRHTEALAALCETVLLSKPGGHRSIYTVGTYNFAASLILKMDKLDWNAFRGIAGDGLLPVASELLRYAGKANHAEQFTTAVI